MQAASMLDMLSGILIWSPARMRGRRSNPCFPLIRAAAHRSVRAVIAHDTGTRLVEHPSMGTLFARACSTDQLDLLAQAPLEVSMPLRCPRPRQAVHRVIQAELAERVAEAADPADWVEISSRLVVTFLCARGTACPANTPSGSTIQSNARLSTLDGTIIISGVPSGPSPLSPALHWDRRPSG